MLDILRISIIAFLSLFAWSVSAQNNVERDIQFDRKTPNLRAVWCYYSAIKELRKHDWVSFSEHVTVYDKRNNQLSRDSVCVICNNSKKKSVSLTALHPDGGNVYLTKDSLLIVNDIDETFTVFARTEDAEEFDKRSLEMSHISFLAESYSQLSPEIGDYVFFKQENNPNLSIYAQLYSEYFATDENGRPYKENGQWVIHTSKICLTYYFSNGLLDSMEKSDGEYRMVVRARNFSFESRKDVIDSIFDAGSRRYMSYTRHNGRSLPCTWTRHPIGGDTLNSTMLDTPMLNAEGDTSFFRNTKGWRLIDVWIFGCRPCYEQLKRYDNERDSLGYRILEKNGVNIYCINPSSNRIDMLKSIADEFRCGDIIFCSKGMTRRSDFGAAPEYVLVSPANEIVYKSRTLGDYSELLKAKQEYEQKHRTK